MTPVFPAPAWVVGCGNMAGAMVEGWRAAGLDFSDVTVIRPSGTQVEAVRTVASYPDEQPQFVMLGFKPQKLDEIASDLNQHVGGQAIVISMLAGVSAASLRQRFPKARAIVRVMPNLPVAQRQGVTAIYSEDGDIGTLAGIHHLMAALGMAVWCKSEGELGVIGAVASAGIAYVARFAEALAKGGEKLGLQPDVAAEVALQTIAGTSVYASLTGASTSEIARRVASPKGTTEQGLAVLDSPDGLQQLVDRTLEAAVRRGHELAAEAAARN